MGDARSRSGRVAIVTGARGIGLAIAAQLAQRGAHVAMLDVDADANEASAVGLR